MNIKQIKKLKNILRQLKKFDAKIEVSYVDFEPGAWTMKMDITEDRLEKFLGDKSADKIRINIDL